MWRSTVCSVVLLATVGTAFGLAFGQSRNASAAGNNQGPPKELSVDLGGGVKMEFVLIPAGTFIMGDDKGWDGELPAHKATITKPFYLGKYEVTQEQWKAVMGDNPKRWLLRHPHPVDCSQRLVSQAGRQTC